MKSGEATPLWRGDQTQPHLRQTTRKQAPRKALILFHHQGEPGDS